VHPQPRDSIQHQKEGNFGKKTSRRERSWTSPAAAAGREGAARRCGRRLQQHADEVGEVARFCPGSSGLAATTHQKQHGEGSRRPAGQRPPRNWRLRRLQSIGGQGFGSGEEAGGSPDNGWRCVGEWFGRGAAAELRLTMRRSGWPAAGEAGAAELGRGCGGGGWVKMVRRSGVCVFVEKKTKSETLLVFFN
jgi:hypothetical protein